MNEGELTGLRKQVQANALGMVVVSIDLYLYKAQIAQRRWGTPGGNDVALEHYQHVLDLLARADWPPDLVEAVQEFASRVTRFRKLLKAQDITRVSFEATRMAEAFRALQEALVAWTRKDA